MKKLFIIFLIAMAFGYSPSYLNFNGGQVSPLLEARPDFQKYRSSCRLIENMHINVQGSAIRRPGTAYMAATKRSLEARLIPFEISTDDTYILELTDNYIRLYRDDGS